MDEEGYVGDHGLDGDATEGVMLKAASTSRQLHLAIPRLSFDDHVTRSGAHNHISKESRGNNLRRWLGLPHERHLDHVLHNGRNLGESDRLCPSGTTCLSVI